MLSNKSKNSKFILRFNKLVTSVPNIQMYYVIVN